MRTFETGATRNSDTNKYDFEGFLSPFVLERYGEYMHHHRKQANGTIRDSDNWQKGIDTTIYMKSLLRHVFDLWRAHRGGSVIDKDTNKETTKDDLLCAIMFNSMGYLHEYIKERKTL